LVVNLAAFDLKTMKLVSYPPVRDVTFLKWLKPRERKSGYFKPSF